jgi:hypothetical protein
MTESKYGSVHKDGSRSGGQPIADTDVQVTRDDLVACEAMLIDLCAPINDTVAVRGAVHFARHVQQSTAKLEADNAALRAEIEALRAEMLRREENERQNCINWGPCSANDDPMNKEPTP